MIALVCFIWSVVTAPFKSKSQLEAENAALRHQLVVLQRKVRGRIEFTTGDRLFFILLVFIGHQGDGDRPARDSGALASGGFPTLLALEIAGTGRAATNQSRAARVNPTNEPGERALGAPRIQGELLKLGFAVAQSTVARYMAKNDDPSGRSWSTFLRNHAPQIAAMDLFVVPTIDFVQLYILVIVGLARRQLVWINTTRQLTAEWIAQQITEAFPWSEAPGYLIRDQDGIYGVAVRRRLRAMGIRDKPIAPGSPWQNGYAERLIGTIRRNASIT